MSLQNRKPTEITGHKQTKGEKIRAVIPVSVSKIALDSDLPPVKILPQGFSSRLPLNKLMRTEAREERHPP